MARLRSIKPEFWTSEQIVDLSPIARLAFVGLWNFCDDAGIHPASARRLKMEVFPGDDFTVEDVDAWVREWVTSGLVEEYSVKNQRYWRVTGWHHQKIDRPTFRYPTPENRRSLDDPLTSTRRSLDEQSPPEWSRVESKGSESTESKNPRARDPVDNSGGATRNGAHPGGGCAQSAPGKSGRINGHGPGGEGRKRHRAPKWSDYSDNQVLEAAKLLQVATRGVPSRLLFEALALRFRQSDAAAQTAVWDALGGAT